jgi:3-oxoacyl-[acyl-carrier protein] reductase
MRNVIVTGGSRGLGLGIARKLAAGGYRAIALARQSNNQLTAAIEQTERQGQGAFSFTPFDLGDIDEIPALVRKLRKDFGPIFGLVNNAALGLDGALAMMHNSQIEKLVRINTLSPIVLTKYVVRSMMAEREGRVVNVASIIGFTGYSGLSVYGATKASMIGFTQSLAPGFMDTEMTHTLGDEQRKQVARRSALRRLPDVDDVANAVEFLLSEKGRSISGTVLTVDAGSTA